MITAANVPPNTIIIGGIRNNAFNEPPSQMNAPKTESTPKINPFMFPNFLIISSLTMIWVKLKQQFSE